MSATKRIIEYHIARLQDKNPEVRLKSIRELEALEAMEALDALRGLYENDPEAEVRKAAQIAGRKIFLANKAKNE